jgi:DNA-binding transcriptional ArsR family regulator
MLGDASVDALAETFKVLGETTRVRILDALTHAGAEAPEPDHGTDAGLPNALCVQDLAALVGLTPSAVSHQLRLLRTARLVRARRAGRQVFYTLEDDHVLKLFEQGLEHVEERT